MVLKAFKWLALTTGVLIVVLIVNLIWFKPFKINHFFERSMLETALESPQMLSQIRLLESAGIKFHQDDLDDYSIAKGNERYISLNENIKTLQSYDNDSLNESERLSKDILMYFMMDIAEGKKWQFHNYPVNQLFGVQNNFPSFMESGHQVHNLEDAEDYISRLSKVDVQFNQVLEGLKHREKLGVIPPAFVIRKVLEEMQNFLATPVENNILYASLAEKLAKIDTMSKVEKSRILAEAKMVFDSNVRPAYETLINYFEYLQPIATDDDGVWKLPEGDAYYAYQVKHHTTTDMTPEQVREVGLSEVDRIQSEMMTLLNREGYDTGRGFKQAMDQLAGDPRFYYEDSTPGRSNIIKDYKVIIEDINQAMNQWFTIQPEAAVDVQRIPQFKEKTAPGAYYQGPAMDGSKPGVFYANLYDIKATPKYGMRTLAYHEAVPGHHFQITIARELKDVPTFRKLLPFTVYSEGWALYAERLAWEAGFHKNATDNLGRLQAELFRAVRLVVDTGIHYKHWTRKQAINYMLENRAMAESDVISEIERYIVNPGQALAYKTGMMKIMALRKRTEKAMGERFDIREFHDLILKNGSMPLAILEQQVEGYISQKL